MKRGGGGHPLLEPNRAQGGHGHEAQRRPVSMRSWRLPWYAVEPSRRRGGTQHKVAEQVAEQVAGEPWRLKL